MPPDMHIISQLQILFCQTKQLEYLSSHPLASCEAAIRQFFSGLGAGNMCVFFIWTATILAFNVSNENGVVAVWGTEVR